MANHSAQTLQLICPQLIVFQFPTLLLFFIEFVGTTCWNRLWKWKNNTLLVIYETFMLRFYTNCRRILSKSYFFQISGVTLYLWLQSYGHGRHFCTSARLLGTNLELFPLLPLHLVLLFQNKMSTRCVGVTGCYSARLWSTPSSTGSRGNKGRSPKLAPSSLAPGQKCPRLP